MAGGPARIGRRFGAERICALAQRVAGLKQCPHVLGIERALARRVEACGNARDIEGNAAAFRHDKGAVKHHAGVHLHRHTDRLGQDGGRETLQRSLLLSLPWRKSGTLMFFAPGISAFEPFCVLVPPR